MRLTKENRPGATAGGNSGRNGADAGDDGVQASDVHGRRWYHLRPKPPGDADLMGFNWSWWTFLLVLLLIL